MSPPSTSIGLNLRVTGYCNQGGRKYMEDVFSVAYQQTEDERDLEYAFFGIFDGHGGREAAVFAKEHLMDHIVRQRGFWADNDDDVLKAIHEGFVQTHQAMWKELEKWPKTASGLPSTAGTTASIAFIRRGKIYVGHVGDSAIVLGAQHESECGRWVCEPLTRDHKPESAEENERIQQSGGKVVCKSGVPRVVWNRPRMGHRGPVRRSTHIDEIPFLAVARSLGDLWSYNSEEDVFVVSPEPDTFVYPIDINRHRCLILGTDGAWNMLTPSQAVSIVCEAERSNEAHMLSPSSSSGWINPSKRLVDKAIERWNGNNLRADNTSVVTVMLDPPGPPRAILLKRQRELQRLNEHRTPLTYGQRGSVALVTNTTKEEEEDDDQEEAESNPQSKSLSKSDTRRLPRVKEEKRGENTSAEDEDPKGLCPDDGMETNENVPVVDSTSSREASSSSDGSSNEDSSNSNSPVDVIQCNEISSSDDDSPTSVKNAKSKKVNNSGGVGKHNPTAYSTPLKALSTNSKYPPAATPSTRLSRELLSLRLDTPPSRPKRCDHSMVKLAQTPTTDRDRRLLKRLERSRTTPNVVIGTPEKRPLSKRMTPKTLSSSKTKKRSTPRLRPELKRIQSVASRLNREPQKQTTPKISREIQMLQQSMKEDKNDDCKSSSKSNNTHYLRSNATPSRALRPRTSSSPTSSFPLSLRKRRMEASLSVSKLTRTRSSTNKSSSAIVRLQKPLLTRARTARILPIKK